MIYALSKDRSKFENIIDKNIKMLLEHRTKKLFTEFNHIFVFYIELGFTVDTHLSHFINVSYSLISVIYCSLYCSLCILFCLR